MAGSDDSKSPDDKSPLQTETPDPGIIQLSRFRAQLARARTRPQADILRDRPDAERYVPTLPVQELFYAIKEIGLHDASDLVALASPEQIRGFFDLDVWQKDHLVEEKIGPWLDALIDAGPKKLVHAINGLDPEMIGLYLQRNANIYELTSEIPPDEPEGHYYPTPDTFYLLDVLPGGEQGKRIERLIDWLYRGNMEVARRVIMSARWELGSDMEEHAYRWRSGRMADLGYVDYYDALDVYQYLDPASVKVGEGSDERPPSDTALPSDFLTALGEGALLGKALATLAEADELERISGALLLLTNRVMAADLVEPGDLDQARGTLERVSAALDLALDFLARGDVGRAADALMSISLTRLFRVGFSLTLKLKKAAELLIAQAWVSAIPGEASLLGSPYSEVVAALRKPKPQFPMVLEQKSGERPFRRVSDITLAAGALEEAALLGETLRKGLGVDPRLLSIEARAHDSPPLDLITFDVIAATLAANLLLDRPPLFVPLSSSDLPALREKALDENRLRPSARLLVTRAFEVRFKEREFEPPAAYLQWFNAWMGHLEQALLVSVEKQLGAVQLLLKKPTTAN